jgi:hypothetical protein
MKNTPYADDKICKPVRDGVPAISSVSRQLWPEAVQSLPLLDAQIRR